MHFNVWSGMRTLKKRHGVEDAASHLTSAAPADSGLAPTSHNLAAAIQAPEFQSFIVNTATTTLELQGEQDGLVVGATGVFQRQAGRAETLDFKDVPDFRVDREGLRRTELTHEQLVARLLDGSARVQSQGPQFEDTLARVVDSLRRDRAGKE